MNIVGTQLRERPNPEKIVVITTPSFKYNPSDLENHEQYCFYQLIKYSSWNRSDFQTLSNIETAIDRWEAFLTEATADVLNYLRYISNLWFLVE
jgi:hypothetical protein